MTHPAPALGYDPLRQSLFQLRVVLLVYLSLHFAAQAVGGTFVGHGWCWLSVSKFGEGLKKKKKKKWKN